MSTAMNPSRKHAYTDAGAAQLPEPTYAERVRTLVSLCTIGTFSTASRKRSLILSPTRLPEFSNT